MTPESNTSLDSTEILINLISDLIQSNNVLVETIRKMTDKLPDPARGGETGAPSPFKQMSAEYSAPFSLEALGLGKAMAATGGPKSVKGIAENDHGTLRKIHRGENGANDDSLRQTNINNDTYSRVSAFFWWEYGLNTDGRSGDKLPPGVKSSLRSKRATLNKKFFNDVETYLEADDMGSIGSCDDLCDAVLRRTPQHRIIH